MAKLFAALENEEAGTQAIETLETMLIDQNEETKQLVDAQEQQETTNVVADVLGQIESAETDAEKVEIAKEHLLSLIGYTKQYSLESFKNDLDKVLNIAQEGLLGRTINSIQQSLTTYEEFNSRYNQALNVIKTNGKRNGIIKDPRWSKYLVLGSKELLSSKDVLDNIVKLEKVLDLHKVCSLYNDLGKIYTQVALQLNDKQNSQHNSLKDLPKLIDRTEVVISDFEKLKNSLNNINGKAKYPNFEPTDYKFAVDLKNIVLKDFKNSYENDMKDFINGWMILTSVARKKGLADVNGAILAAAKGNSNLGYGIIGSISRIMTKLNEMLKYRQNIAYAVLRYIESSTAK